MVSIEISGTGKPFLYHRIYLGVDLPAHWWLGLSEGIKRIKQGKAGKNGNSESPFSVSCALSQKSLWRTIRREHKLLPENSLRPVLTCSIFTYSVVHVDVTKLIVN